METRYLPAEYDERYVCPDCGATWDIGDVLVHKPDAQAEYIVTFRNRYHPWLWTAWDGDDVQTETINATDPEDARKVFEDNGKDVIEVELKGE
jgi:hypothetical protein